jgi:hypothetical protein
MAARFDGRASVARRAARREAHPRLSGAARPLTQIIYYRFSGPVKGSAAIGAATT